MRHLDGVALRPRSAIGALSSGDRYRDLEAYCMFIGYPRSGHSMVGSLLDAHPEVGLAHELDALKFLERGYTRNQLFHLILANTRRTARRGRVQTGYSYEVPGQWQGRWSKLRVIGDKKGARSTRRLDEHPELLERLRETIDLPLRFIHVVRNPFDNIATIAKRDANGGLVDPADALAHAIRRYDALARAVGEFLDRVDPSEVWEGRHEDFIASPRERLRELCAFLDLEASEDYLDSCAGVLFGSPNASRRSAAWAPEQIEQVQRIIARHDFLEGYAYDVA